MASGVEMELIAAVLICASLAVREDTVKEDVVKAGRVGLFWMTGTHWPNDCKVDTLLTRFSGSPTERTQYAPAGMPIVVDV